MSPADDYQLRLAATIGMRFDSKDPRAVAWAKKHAAELARELSETTTQEISAALVRSFEGESHQDLMESIIDSVGDETRGVLIARTETMIAANEGQRQSWAQAVDEGLLTGDERREWLTVGDGVPPTCEECESLDGKTAPLNGEYPDPGGDGPPLHPNCRCTEGIAAGGTP